MDDEDFDEEETDYRKICHEILAILNRIKENLIVFDSIKLLEYQKRDLKEIKEELGKSFSEYDSSVFIHLMDISCQIEDLLKEIMNPIINKFPKKTNLVLVEMSKLIEGVMNKYMGYYKED